MNNPFRYFNSSPEVIRLAVMMYIRYPLSLRQIEDILFERGTDICHETIRYWWNRFGPKFAAEIRKRRIKGHNWSNWRWHLDEVFVRINGERHYLWRAVDHEGEVLEAFVTKRHDRQAALKFLKRTMKRYGRPSSIVTDRLPSYRAAMKALGNPGRQDCGRWLNNRAENSHLPFRRREGAMARFRDIKTLQKFAAGRVDDWRGGGPAQPDLYPLRFQSPLGEPDVRIIAVGTPVARRPHLLRHACAIHTLEATGDVRKVSLWLGHSSLQTTEMYLQADPTDKLDTLDK